MKVLLTVLIILLLGLQYRLWFGDGSLQELSQLRRQASESRAEVLRLNNRNQALAAEVADLKSGLEAIEERARAELGMISEGETFYQFVRERGASERLLNTVPARPLLNPGSAGAGESDGQTHETGRQEAVDE